MTVVKRRAKRTTRLFERALSEPEAKPERYVLRLYITGMTYRSLRAIETIRDVCIEYLDGRYDLEIIDIYQRPALAKEAQIVAAPTLVKKLPAPLRRLIGNLADEDRVLAGLELEKKQA